MALGAQNSQTASFTHLRRQLDVGTTAGHVGGNGNGACLTSLGHNLGLTLVLLGVQHVMLDAAHFQHSA